jgi:H+-transporting ATPase
LVALVATQLGQTLIDSHDPLVVSTAVGSLMALGGLISTPVVSQLLGSTPLGPLGWAQALGTAGAATTVAAVAPKLLGLVGRDAGNQSSMSTTPARHSTAYSSRNGTVSSRETASVNGSGPMDTETPATPVTVGKSGIQTSNSP